MGCHRCNQSTLRQHARRFMDRECRPQFGSRADSAKAGWQSAVLHTRGEDARKARAAHEAGAAFKPHVVVQQQDDTWHCEKCQRPVPNDQYNAFIRRRCSGVAGSWVVGPNSKQGPALQRAKAQLGLNGAAKRPPRTQPARPQARKGAAAPTTAGPKRKPKQSPAQQQQQQRGNSRKATAAQQQKKTRGGAAAQQQKKARGGADTVRGKASSTQQRPQKRKAETQSQSHGRGAPISGDKKRRRVQGRATPFAPT